VLRRLPSSADTSLASGATATVQTLAAVQRLEGASTPAGPSASPSSGGNGSATGATAAAPSSLPLHTPAASIPSAADVVVKAGLAERGPTGELFYTSPPAGSSASFDVQRLEDDSSPSSDGEAPVQREFASARRPSTARSEGPAVGAHRAAASPSPVSEANHSTDPVSEAKNRAEEAKKLYPYIRSALEADLRRQLEGKSRAGRFRP
jgi:hypothetical protein